VASVDPEVVAIEARRVAATKPDAPVIPIGVLDARPTPTLDGYDDLLASGGAS